MHATTNENDTLRLRIKYDHGNESPCEWGNWMVHSFSRDHVGFTDPDEAPDVNEPGNFALSYTEHGNCEWTLLNGTGFADRFDSVRFAGVLEWTGGDSHTPTEANAEAFIRTYTDWCNGNVYWLCVEREKRCECCGNVEWEHVDSCGGFYFSDWTNAKAELEDIVLGHFDVDLSQLTVTGEASFIAG